MHSGSLGQVGSFLAIALYKQPSLFPLSELFTPHANRISLATFQKMFPLCLLLLAISFARLVGFLLSFIPEFLPPFRKARYVSNDQLTLLVYFPPICDGCHPLSCFDLKINKQHEIKQTDPHPPHFSHTLDEKFLCMIFP